MCISVLSTFKISIVLTFRLLDPRRGEESRPGEDPYGISIALLIQSLDQSLFIPLISYKEKKFNCARQFMWSP